MPDAVLVADKSRFQEVKQAVEDMKNMVTQAENFREIIGLGDGLKH